MPLNLTRAALTEIAWLVGGQAPEAGGKLFSPWDKDGADVFEFDERGSRNAGRAVYAPDVAWGDARLEFWANQPEPEQRVWHGDVHSHPGGYGFPSRAAGKGLGDLGYAAEVLRMNEHLLAFYIPIVTQGRGGRLLLWPWMVQREQPTEALYCDVRLMAASEFPPRSFNPEWTARVEAPADGPSGASAAPAYDEKRATTIAVSPERYGARLAGVVSPELARKRVVFVGCGGGSEMIVRIARQGVGEVRLVDFDHVEVENLCRTAFSIQDLGKPKVEALARLVTAANPFVEVTTSTVDITALEEAEVADLLEGVDLLVAGTDSFAAQALINRWSVAHRIPAVFIGVHEGARGGIIVWSIPGETPCYRCVSRRRYEVGQDGGAQVDLPGARGSAIDVGFIDAAASKVIMGLLERGQDSDFGRFLEGAHNRNMVVVRTHPSYRWEDGLDVFDTVLSDLPTAPRDFSSELKEQVFHAVDTLWLGCDRNVTCPDCAHLHGGDVREPESGNA